MRKILLLGFVFVLLTMFQGYGQTDVTISGRLVDKDGAPVPGANVYVKGTKIGTVTDAEGNYTITVPQGSVLVFAGAGYLEKTVKVGNQTVINLTLEEEQIEAITVTSYGQVIDKTTTTGAITAVSGKDFENLPMQSFDRAIQGRLAGVAVNAASGAPGGGLTVRIRGTGSVLASNAPLYIVDGVQVNPGGISTQGSSNALGSINPNDIETIEVLKDASAAAIYGAQSANGVVIITTKKGKRNSDRFNFTAQEGWVQPIRLYEVLNGPQYAALKREAALNDLYQPQLPPPTLAQIATVIANANALYGDPDDSTLVDFSWKKALFRVGRLRTYDFSYSGGGDKTRFYISAAYQRQEGQIIKNFWERTSVRFNIENRPSRRFSLQSNNTISTQSIFGAIAGGDGNFLNSPFFGAFRSAPTLSAFLPDGSFAQYTNNVLAFNYNIVQGVNEEVRRGNGVQAVSSMKATYNFLPELAFTAFAGIDWLNNRDENIRPATIPAFAPGNMTNRYDRDFAINTNYTLTYNKTFAEKHNFSALVGYEYRYRQTMFTTAFGRSFNPNISVLNGVANGTTPTTVSSVSGNVVENDRAGFFSQLRYNFKEKYFVDVTGRRDGSSKFGLKNRYGNFYAAAVAWRLSKEAFMESIQDQLSELKLKASYGYVGNSEINDYQNVTTFGAGVQYLGINGLRPTVLGNDLLTWEGSVQTNLGIDFGFLRGSRIFGSIDFWRRDTQDALFSVSIPADAGQRPSSVIRNVGKIRNQGVDFEIGANILDNPEGLQWRSSFNITYQQNKVLELPEGNNVMIVAGREVFKGQPLNTYVLNVYAGVNPATGQPMYYDANNNIVYQPLSYQVNPDKTIDFRDNRILGTALPKLFGGWNNQFSFKGITLDFLWQYQYGNVTYNSDYWANLLTGMSAGNNNVTKVLERWQKPGDITNVPRLSLAGNYNGVSTNLFSSRFLEDASYIRLKTITLGYNVPQDALKGLQSARIFVQAVNLLTFTKANIIDPEVVSTTGNPTSLLGGINQFPQGRQFSVGVSLGF
jgi:TonB-linked SusC/RagA family outer membrane protein